MVALCGLFFTSTAVCIAATASGAGNAFAPISVLDCKAAGGQCEATKVSDDGTDELNDETMLFQSERTVTSGGVHHTAGPADIFDVFDEYDEFIPIGKASSLKSSLAERIAQADLPDHFFDPAFYLMAGFYGFCFAIVAKLHSRYMGAECDEDEDEDLAPSLKVSPAASKAAPVFDSGPIADFEGLAQAVRSGDEARCSQMVQARNATRQEDACGCTALHIAAQCDAPAMARNLIKHGARVNAKEVWEETPLHIAAREGSTEVCKVLVEHGAEIDAVNANNRTPLLVAADAGKEAVCEMLLDKGAGVGGRADSELPPLLNALIVRRMFAGAKPQDLDMDAMSSEDETDFD